MSDSPREIDFSVRVCQRAVKWRSGDYCITRLIFCIRVVKWGPCGGIVVGIVWFVVRSVSRRGGVIQGEEEEAKEDARGDQERHGRTRQTYTLHLGRIPNGGNSRVSAPRQPLCYILYILYVLYILMTNRTLKRTTRT